jgi:hypothetical protein
VELPPGPTCQRESPRVYVGQTGQGSSALDVEVFAHGASPPRGAATRETVLTMWARHAARGKSAARVWRRRARLTEGPHLSARSSTPPMGWCGVLFCWAKTSRGRPMRLLFFFFLFLFLFSSFLRFLV